MAQRTALLLGATGLVGGHCLHVLLSDPRYRHVTVLARRPLPATSPNLSVHTIEFDRLAGHADRFAVDDIYCCLGTTIRVAGSQEAFRKVDYRYPAEAARLGATAGARQFLLVSSVGANASSGNFYLRVKGEVEEAVQKSGVGSVVIARPSMLLGHRAESRPGERLAVHAFRALAIALVGPARKYRPVEAHTVARALCRAATDEKRGTRILESDAIERLGAP